MSRQIIAYKDASNARVKYFGPFASEVIAYEFSEALPAPLEGGYKLVKHLSPFGAHEADLAHATIILQRDPSSPTHRASRIVA
jgi:hypothetical protein